MEEFICLASRQQLIKENSSGRTNLTCRDLKELHETHHHLPCGVCITSKSYYLCSSFELKTTCLVYLVYEPGFKPKHLPLLLVSAALHCFPRGGALTFGAAEGQMDSRERERELLLLSQPVAVHLLRPTDTKHVHEFVAVALGLQTEAAAGQGHPAVLRAHRDVERAQEHPELR